MKINLKKSVRAQAALEFLTTYGWAFLIILIMIGTLAYFGILSPSKLTPNRCNFGSEFQCLDYQIKDLGTGADDTFRLRLKNNVGETITMDSIALTKEDGNPYACTTAQPMNTLSSWAVSAVKDLVWTACTFGDLTKDQKGKILVTLTYHSVSSGEDYKKQVKGEVFANVLAS